MSDENQGQANTGADGDSTTLAAQAAAQAAATGGEGGAPDNTGAAPGGDKGEGDKGAAGAPEAYADFSLPEAYQLDETTLGAFKDAAKAANLTQDAAQGMLDVFAKHYTSAVEANVTAFKQASEQWANEFRADKEFGGAKFDASVTMMGSAIEKFGDKDFIAVLNQSQLGNHPAVCRFLARVGQAISEAPLNNGGGGDGPGGEPKPVHERLYPNQAAQAA